MYIIIDGYNLLKSLLKSNEISAKERQWFHAQMTEYARKKGHSIAIIYDGGSFDRPTAEKKGAITTIYSGYRSTADDVIKDMIDEKAHHDMLVVTTDNKLSSYAVRWGIPTMRSADFYKIMLTEEVGAPEFVGYKRVAGEAHKSESHVSSADIDALMQEASSVLLYKEEGDGESEKPGQKRSKKERLAAKIVKKL